MPTNDELRAARERLRTDEYVGEFPCDIDAREWRDLDIVREAYLAEHPPDEDEPVTAEWLESQGWDILHNRDVNGVKTGKIWCVIKTLDKYELVWTPGKNTLIVEDLFCEDRIVLYKTTCRQLNHLVAAFEGE